MAAYSYWRLTGFLTDSNALELSQAQLYDGAQLIAQAPTFTVAPTTGTAFPDTLHWDDFSMPGFALVWALATPVANPNLRLGAGSSADNFPKEFYCQYSDDGLFWSTNNAPTNVAFPGEGLLTAAPGTGSAVGDPDFSKVSLLLHMDGANGSTVITDSSPFPKVVTRTGTCAISTAVSKFGGSSLYLPGSGSGASVVPSAAFQFGAGDFTMEAWVFPLSVAGTSTLFYYGPSTDTNNGAWFWLQSGGVQGNIDPGTGAIAASAPNVPANVWSHVAFVRHAGGLQCFVNGVGGAVTATSVDVGIPTAPLVGIGYLYNTSTLALSGYLDDLRITKGEARYTADFTPPTQAFPTTAHSLIPLSTAPAAKRWRTLSLFDERIAGSELPAHNLREVTMETSFMDAYHGGNGRLYGTVKEKHAPLDIPLRREVILIDKASRLTIRVTWSDSITGDYEFIGIRMGVKYTVLAYDHFNIYRVVGADEQIPELML